MGGIARAIVSPLSIIDKDLGRIALQITAVAAAFIPGGQPIAAAAALALAVLYRPKGPKPEQQERSIKTPLPPRIAAYGRVRLHGAYILYMTNEDGYAVDVWAFHDGQIDGIERLYLGDYQVTLTGGGFVKGQEDGMFGSGNDTIQIATRLGLPTETAMAEVMARLPGIWTADHRGDGVVTGAMISKPVKAKNYNEVYPTGGPDANTLSLVLRAQRVFDWRDPSQSVTDPATWKWSDNAALCTAHYYLTRYYKDWDTHFAPTLDYWTAFADDCDVQMAVYHGSAVLVDDESSGTGTLNFSSVEGLANGTVVTFPQYGDTRTVVSVAGNEVTLNSGIPKDYKAGTVARWIGGGTEPRYRVALAHKFTDQHKVTIGNLLACCDGFVAPRADGALIAYSGRYTPPEPDDYIGPDEIINFSWDEGIADEDEFNEIAISYISKDHDYNTVDAQSWRDDDAISESGEVKPTTLENSVPSHSQARRLAKRLLSKTLAPNRGSVTTNRAGRKIRGKRYITLHIEEAGAIFFSGVAEIVRLRRNVSTGGVTFDWIRADPNIDAWNAATEEGEPAPVGIYPATTALETPIINDAEAELGEDGANARIRITADGFDRDDITWFARWRVTTDGGAWAEQEYTDIDPGPTVELLTNLVPTNVSIDVAIAYSTGDGRISPWSATASVSTSTAGLSPSPPTGVSGTGGTGTATVNWTNAPSANLSYSRVYRNTTSTAVGATLVSGDLPSSPGATQSYGDTVGAGTYYYFVRGFSASGANSTPVGTGAVVVT